MMYLDGQDLRALPVIERKAKLWGLVKPAEGVIQYSTHVEGGVAEFYGAVDKMGLGLEASEHLLYERCVRRPGQD
ncbi:hypothetical protein [Mesorhizobium sp. M1B.F.Ca.ET.045.04.1.1]|uniref:hypothetical protein n=1 Tax=Mesorhizobium sp. M1B.F.Ca.ET.045.04.1.1 TaxID=2493673 RepID=UPI00167B1D4A|nr:hypothetical protein [Mesorhizobium sp. M1B.F.Ca.ET.045.04.1.1]